jgi:hypothetical protein
MSRIRTGEWVAATGAIGLLVMLFFDWVAISFKGSTAHRTDGLVPSAVVSHGSLSGWGTLGWLMDVLLGIVIVGGLSLAYMNAKRTSPAWPVGAGVLTWALGAGVLLILVVRLIFLAGDLGAVAVGLRLPAYLGIVFAALIPLGAFLSLKDDRTDSPDARAYTPPPARPVPGS